MFFKNFILRVFLHLLPRFCLIPECGLSWPCGRPTCTTVDMPKRFCQLLSHLNLRDQRTNPPCSSDQARAINTNIFFCLAYRINSDLFATHAAVLKHFSRMHNVDHQVTQSKCTTAYYCRFKILAPHEKKKYGIIQRLWLPINICASYYDVSINKAI